MNVSEAEGFATLVRNWREAEELGDSAASEAFEDELHARVSVAEITNLKATDPRTGEHSTSQTDQLRSSLQRMWNNASARLD